MPARKITQAAKTRKKKVITKQNNFIDCKIMKDMFNRKIINHIASETNFTRRIRKLDAYNFFSLVFGSLKEDRVSLSFLAENMPVSISRMGINKRFNSKAVDFLQGVSSHLFAVIRRAQKNSLPIGIFKKFKSIQMIDSSSWKVPVALKDHFPGYNQAGCKVQFMLDYKTGIIQHSNISQETYADQQYSKGLADMLQKDDLSLFDLGFAIAETLNKIDAKGAYFICRFNDAVMNVYKDNGPSSAKIDILKQLDSLKDSKAVYEIPCFIGNQNQRTKVRSLAVRVPEEIANRRRQKLRAQAKKKGWTPKERSLKLCDWTLMITNIPPEKGISFQEIFALYSIRWTIEIFFKQLKSVLNIHKTYVKSNPNHLKAEILARSIAALFITYCFSVARTKLWYQAEREISFEKTVKYFKRHAAILMDRFLRSIRQAVIYLQQMIFQIISSCEKYRQPSRENSLDKLIEQTFYGKIKYVKLAQPNLVGFTP